MSKPLLSILIPTVVGREESYNRFCKDIFFQCRTFGLVGEGSAKITPNDYGGEEMDFGQVVIQSIKDNKEMPVGKKRGILYKKSKGLYSFMPDDDDSVASNFIEKVLDAIKNNMDCITYFEDVEIDGVKSKSNHSIGYTKWHDDPMFPEGFKYARTPYFKDVIKTEIAQRVEVPEIRWNEDEQWANALHPLLKTEYHIDEFMYFYKTISSNPIEKYGLNK